MLEMNGSDANRLVGAKFYCCEGTAFATDQPVFPILFWWKVDRLGASDRIVAEDRIAKLPRSVDESEV